MGFRILFGMMQGSPPYRNTAAHRKSVASDSLRGASFFGSMTIR